jgi:hypothetical protein
MQIANEAPKRLIAREKKFLLKIAAAQNPAIPARFIQL